MAIGTLIAASLIIAWPIISGGYVTYVDNPAHLAEVHALADEAQNGWSDIAFCGFPIGHLHSPLWYGILGRLVGWGLPAGPLYAFMVWLGFVAPSLALFWMARRRLPVMWAAVLAYILLVQRPAIVGLGSALGGMWTFYLAAGGFILLLDRLTQPCRTRRDVAWIAALVGFIGLTHLFTVVPLLVLAVVHLVCSVRRRAARSIPPLFVAAAVGLVAAAAYWLPLLMSREHTTISPQNLPFFMIVTRLLLPTEILDLLVERVPARTPLTFVEALPLFVLVLSGIAGVYFRRYRRDAAPLYGWWVAAVVFVLVAIVAPATDAKFMGPVGWRMLYFVRIGLIIGAVPFVAWVAIRLADQMGRRASVAAAIAAVGLAVGWGAPLRADATSANSVEMQEVRALWEWLDKNKSDKWGRVYLQDTFMTRPLDVRLGSSHILALTSHETGVRQLGATYAVVPFPTATWTLGEFGTLFRRLTDTDERRSYLIDMMWRTNCSVVVMVDPAAAGQLRATDQFEALYQVGRYDVLRLVGAESRWVAPKPVEADAQVLQYSTGRIRVKTGADVERLLIKVAWHPFWKIQGVEGAILSMDEFGLMVVENLGDGAEFDLVYDPPKWPMWVSLFGWSVIGVLFVLGATQRRTVT